MMFTKCVWGSSLTAIVLTCGVTAYAADVTGVLVDEACYNFSKANITQAHKDMGETCATECAKKGNQVALVTKTGEIYEVMVTGALAKGEKNATLIPHMAHTVTLTGTVAKGAAGKPMQIRATALKMISE